MKRFWILVIVWCASFGAMAQVSEERAAYLQVRKDLVAADSMLRYEGIPPLTAREQELDTKLETLQREMLAAYKAQHFFPPARYFTQSKTHIESTPLFKVFQQMPKGGIHHLHVAAGGDARWVANRVLETPSAHVYWGPASDQFIKGQLRCFFEESVPEGFVQAATLQETVPQLADSLVEMLTFDESIDGDSVDIWMEFEKVFKRMYGFISYRPVFVAYTTDALDRLVADGIQHAEMRMLLGARLYDETHQQGEIPVDTLLADLEAIIADVQLRDPGFTAKTIYTNLRFRDLDYQWQDLQIAFALRKQYPDLIKGYDLVAEEDNGNPTRFHLDNFLRLDSLEGEYGIEMPLYLHDGESDWVSIDNLYDAILLNTRRIGHGFNLFRFPSMIEEAKKRNICLEVNPLSNQILGYVRDLRMHPASIYLSQGVPISISSDDPLIFDYAGLSYDFWSIYLAWELDLRQIKQLCRNSLTYSALNEAEKARAFGIWEARWKQFIEKTLVNWDLYRKD